MSRTRGLARIAGLFSSSREGMIEEDTASGLGGKNP